MYCHFHSVTHLFYTSREVTQLTNSILFPQQSLTEKLNKNLPCFELCLNLTLGCQMSD